MAQQHERDAIEAATVRLLEGKPLRSDGALTVVSLATEAGVKRHVLTHRHTDLKDLFYARIRAQGHIPASEVKLREDLAEARRRLADANVELASVRGTVDRLARVVNVLTVENDALREQVDTRKGTVVPMR